jgi:TatA/E family protein of Tat protein translocase
MGIGAWWHWLIVLVVVVLIFGTKKLRNLGGDVGGAVKGFKDAMNEEKDMPQNSSAITNSSEVIDVQATQVPVVKTPAKRKAPAAKKTAAPKATPASTSTASKPVAKKTSTAKPRAVASKKTAET